MKRVIEKEVRIGGVYVNCRDIKVKVLAIDEYPADCVTYERLDNGKIQKFSHGAWFLCWNPLI